MNDNVSYVQITRCPANNCHYATLFTDEHYHGYSGAFKAGEYFIKDLKKKMDGFARELGKDTEAVRKKLSEQAMEAQVSAQKAADDAVRAAGGETKRDKLERLFASDAEEVPTDENLSEFERFLENRRKGGSDADFYASKEKAKKDSDDDDWLGAIKYKPPPK